MKPFYSGNRWSFLSNKFCRLICLHNSLLAACFTSLSVPLLVSEALAQTTPNMVLNPGFEKYLECPLEHNSENKSHKLVPGWSYPNEAASDYFNRCSKGEAGVPRNFAGESEPKEGNGYVGAILTGDAKSGVDNINRREYIQGELNSAMVAGKKYCVMYNYRLASDSKFAVDQLSVLFIDQKIVTTGTHALGGSPQIINLPGLFLDNVEGWKQMCYVYEAKGGERFFTIGNFRGYETTNYVATGKNVVNSRNKAYAYYYFDDVSVRPLENCNDCPCVRHNFDVAVVDTSFSGGADPYTGKARKLINDGRIRLSVLGGTPPYLIKWSNGAEGAALKGLPAGKYMYYASDAFNCRASGTIVFRQPPMATDDFAEGLRNIEEGAAIVLENIFFDFNKTDLLPVSFAELDKVVDFMISQNVKLIEISGHTDSDGADAYNLKLSEGRARSVVNYLSTKGVPADRMQARGYGESRPLETNKIDIGKAVNRRVEFRLIKK